MIRHSLQPPHLLPECRDYLLVGLKLNPYAGFQSESANQFLFLFFGIEIENLIYYGFRNIFKPLLSWAIDLNLYIVWCFPTREDVFLPKFVDNDA